MIKRIRIQNFRSLVDVTVDLDPLTVLIGRSGTGKSNFVRAVRFLRDSLTVRDSSFDENGGVARILHVDGQKDSLSYELTFSLPGYEEELFYFLRFTPRSNSSEESLRVGDKISFHHNQHKWIVAPNVSPLPAPAKIMLGAIPGLQDSTFAYFALRSGIGCYDFPGKVLESSGVNNFPMDQGLVDKGDNYLHVADRILSDLRKSSDWKRIAKSIRAVNRNVANLTLNAPTPNRLDVGLQVNGRLLTFDVRQESEGFRRYLAHLLALYQSPSKQSLLFEHPESGLHPGALESLAEEFKDCPEEGRGQVILTTHSPQLLDYFPPESIRVVTLDHHQTRIGPLAPEQLKSVKEQLLHPGELLTVDPARLEGQLNEVVG